ncbi:MAG: uncharacterized protein QOK37_1946 [Thermoanaerobaculia bacterium]|jgi:hypothetical protein|nr:uncharacterized protein [Thermoanaerobaculia bacterium]
MATENLDPCEMQRCATVTPARHDRSMVRRERNETLVSLNCALVLLTFAITNDVRAADFSRRVFMGTLAKKTNVDIAVATLPDGEIVGAVYYPNPVYPHPFFERFDDIVRLSGKRHGSSITLVEERDGAPGATIVARIVKTDLRGTWRLPGSRRAIPFDFGDAPGSETPLLYERRTWWRPLDRMHDAIRAGRLDVAAAQARLACAMNDEGCEWVQALSSVVMGKEPPPAARAPWRGFLLEVQGKTNEAIAAGRERCGENYPGFHSACRFLVDLAPRLPFAEERAVYEMACRTQHVACDHVFGKAEVALAEAAEQGDVAGAERILQGTVNVNFGSEWRYSPLFCATAAGSLPIVRMLLAHGADPNLKNGYEPPLEYAVDSHRNDIAMTLLEHGAKVTGVADGALWKSVYDGNHTVALKMLANGEDPDDGVPAGSPLTAAVDKRDLVMVKALLTHGADPEWESKYSDGSPIDHARKAHQTKILRLLLAAKKSAEGRPE